MKVRATELGYYSHKRRYPGDVFVLEPIERLRKVSKDSQEMKKVVIRPEQQFSERWMEKVEEDVPTSNVKPKNKKPQQEE